MYKLTIFATFSVLLLCLMTVSAKPVDSENKDKPCSCIATLEFLPVCGTDGYTYPSRGVLRCGNECGRQNVEVLHEGQCEEKEAAA